MEDSSTYQLLVEREARGAERGVRDLILVQGSVRFGPPNATTRDALHAIHDPEALAEIGRRLITATNWAEALHPEQ